MKVPTVKRINVVTVTGRACDAAAGANIRISFLHVLDWYLIFYFAIHRIYL